MPNSCQELRDALAQCLQESECVMLHRNRAADCLREPLFDTLPPRCQQLKKGFGACKRGLVDMRKRFRGNTPVNYSAIESGEAAAAGKDKDKGDGGSGSGSGSGSGYQLYAGRAAFTGGVRQTDGNEPIPRDWREVENEKYAEMQRREREGGKAA